MAVQVAGHYPQCFIICQEKQGKNSEGGKPLTSRGSGNGAGCTSAGRKQGGSVPVVAGVREREGLRSKVELLLCTCCEPFWNLRAHETPKM